MELSTQQQPNERERLLDRYYAVRSETVRLCEPLELEDFVIQTMPDVSPPKWHLAHTSWFFETFLLAAYDQTCDNTFKPFHPQYDYLFNSYYITHGKPYLRPQRGLLSRPTVDEIMQYRAWVDEAMVAFIIDAAESDWQEISYRITLGLNHEQQHQELLLTDIKHILAFNPLKPVYQQASPVTTQNVQPLSWLDYKAGLVTVGHQGQGSEGVGFAYDNEGPAHQVYVNPFKLASRLVTNAEYLEFMNDEGYQRPEFWLSEGWARHATENWQAPLYWEKIDNEWWTFSLEGMQRFEPGAPVCHVSLYEADAYARWAGKRLPTEFEWEVAASGEKIAGNLREQNCLKPVAAKQSDDMEQLYGDVWEWTSSAYSAYPGYRPASGAIGEYNGKFMSGQNVLRGGSFATPQDHIRSTYRNFFYPKDRWQFSGIRLAD